MVSQECLIKAKNERLEKDKLIDELSKLVINYMVGYNKAIEMYAPRCRVSQLTASIPTKEKLIENTLNRIRKGLRY